MNALFHTGAKADGLHDDGFTAGIVDGENAAGDVACVIYCVDLEDPQGSYISANCSALLGLHPDEVNLTAANWWQDLLHPDDVARLNLTQNPQNWTNGAIVRKFRLRRTDGAWVQVLDHAMITTMGAAQGNPKIVGSMRALPDAANSEMRARKELCERNEFILDHVAEGILVHDLSGQVVRHNAAASGILGVNPAQFENWHPLADGVRLLDETGTPIDIADHPVNVVLRTGFAFDAAIIGVCRGSITSDTIWVRMQAIPAYNPETDEFDSVVISFSDISDVYTVEKAMAERESIYRQMFLHNPAIKLLIDPETGVIHDANAAALRFYGYSHEQLCHMTIRDINVQTGDQVGMAMERTVTDGSAHFSFHHRLASGEVRDVEVNTGTIRIHGKEFLHSIIFDVTERNDYAHRLEQANLDLVAERQRLDEIIRGTNAGTWEWNIQTGDMRFNERWAEIIGYTLKELGPLSIQVWRDLCHPDDLAASDRLLDEHFAGRSNYYQCECRIRHKNGKWVWVLDRGKVFDRAADGTPLRMSGTHSDITPSKTIEAQIRQMALTDPLTGLANRHLFNDRLDQAIRLSERIKQNVALLLLDLDWFKQVNDTYGHPAGDKLLIEIATFLRSRFRDADVVARLGGDEFAILLPAMANPEEAQIPAARIIQEIGRPRMIDGHEIIVGASIGISYCKGCECDAENLYRKADRALYLAKKGGRNTYRTIAAC
ncbi:diguanylate cyclase domain-containing protein [Thalassospira sp. MCCC 1A01428]|uniref:diguanylate cyclase domain-containing protein n=1 Tax=Thalassospira sp. MCCC 1A01428 TaxID=1470575 RepID=UPI000A1F3F1B|nr:diguanylate cyclase [Thalassospira sp. MCCC 1A01428]